MLADTCDNILRVVSAKKCLIPNILDVPCHCIVLYILVELISLATKPKKTKKDVFCEVLGPQSLGKMA